MHPVDVLLSCGLLRCMRVQDMWRYFHVHANRFYPVNRVEHTLHRLPTTTVIENSGETWDGIRQFVECISKLLNSNMATFAAPHNTTDENGLSVPTCFVGNRNNPLMDLAPGARLFTDDWKWLHKLFMDCLGVSLVHVFFPKDGYLRNFLYNGESIKQVHERMEIYFPQDHLLPWVSVFMHPLFRRFMPRMSTQPARIREQALTNVFYGESAAEESIDFDYNIFRTVLPNRNCRSSVASPFMNYLVYDLISIQEAHNQRLIVDQKVIDSTGHEVDVLFLEYMQVRTFAFYLWQ